MFCVDDYDSSSILVSHKGVTYYMENKNNYMC
jgi:hypothetical protein